MQALRKIKLTIAYDGTDFHGWQIQPGYRTVQGTLCEVAIRVLRHEVMVQGASRTDAGVHAQGQLGLLQTYHPMAVEKLQGALNEALPDDIVIQAVQEVSPDYGLLDHVKRKWYRYTLCRDRLRPWRWARFCWHYPGPLDISAMQQTVEMLMGRHDFASFAARLEPGQNTVRTLSHCQLSQTEWDGNRLLHVDLEGEGFLFHMVRIIVGTCVDIGRGHWPASHIQEILAACDRSRAGHCAPAQGLCLMEITE